MVDSCGRNKARNLDIARGFGLKFCKLVFIEDNKGARLYFQTALDFLFGYFLLVLGSDHSLLDRLLLAGIEDMEVNTPVLDGRIQLDRHFVCADPYYPLPNG